MPCRYEPSHFSPNIPKPTTCSMESTPQPPHPNVSDPPVLTFRPMGGRPMGPDAAGGSSCLRILGPPGPSSDAPPVDPPGPPMADPRPGRGTEAEGVYPPVAESSSLESGSSARPCDAVHSEREGRQTWLSSQSEQCMSASTTYRCNTTEGEGGGMLPS